MLNISIGLSKLKAHIAAAQHFCLCFLHIRNCALGHSRTSPIQHLCPDIRFLLINYISESQNRYDTSKLTALTLERADLTPPIGFEITASIDRTIAIGIPALTASLVPNDTVSTFHVHRPWNQCFRTAVAIGGTAVSVFTTARVGHAFSKSLTSGEAFVAGDTAIFGVLVGFSGPDVVVGDDFFGFFVRDCTHEGPKTGLTLSPSHA